MKFPGAIEIPVSKPGAGFMGVVKIGEILIVYNV